MVQWDDREDGVVGSLGGAHFECRSRRGDRRQDAAAIVRVRRSSDQAVGGQSLDNVGDARWVNLQPFPDLADRQFPVSREGQEHQDLVARKGRVERSKSDAYRDFGRAEFLGLPLYFYFVIVLALIIWFVLEQTPLGRYLFATGGNVDAARLSGLPTDVLRWGTLVASAVVASFAGLIHTWKVGTYSSSIGPGFLFPAVAAVFFGASQSKGRPNVWGTLIAVYALAFGVEGLQLTFTSGTAWIEPLFEGVSLLIAVALASRQGVIKVPKRKKATEGAAPPPDAEPVQVSEAGVRGRCHR